MREGQFNIALLVRAGIVVSEGVDPNDLESFSQKSLRQMGADESGAPRYQAPHYSCVSPSRPPVSWKPIISGDDLDGGHSIWRTPHKRSIVASIPATTDGGATMYRFLFSVSSGLRSI